VTDGSPAPRFDGRLAVVTGVGRAGQVGEAVARRFGELGATVALLARDADDGEARADELRRDGIDAHAYACDLSDAAALAAVANLVAALGSGRVDALANVAGGFSAGGSVADGDPAAWQAMFAINVATAFGATRAFLPFLRAGGGAVVFVAAASVLPGGKVANIGAYAASKAAVVALMRTIAQEEKPHGVRANALAPTAIRTAANLGTMGSGFPYVEREAFADVVAFLCSPAARNVTGQVIELA
jgi:NAD(P)-dependent dehydrogenase (short-subunit alcohol dehydrogenase family)